MQRLRNKVAIVTGGGSGIGAATAALFAREGAKVLVVGRNEEKLRSAVQSINHENVSYAVADVSKVEDTQRFIAEAVKRYGGLDVMVCNAGDGGLVMPITDYSVEDFDSLMAINVRGVWLSMKFAFPELKKRGGGSIIATSSIYGFRGMGGGVPYATSKHAVIGLVRSVAHEGAPFRIRVNAVAPGATDNDMMRSMERQVAPNAPQAVYDMVKNRVPLKRYGTNEEVAKMMLFLASDESSYVTGSIHAVDGGITAGVM